MIIMLSIAVKGAYFPDVDHHWKAVKEKTVFNYIINKLIHITGGKHRSKHTHSIEICALTGILLYYGLKIGYEKELITNLNYEVALIILLSFYSGWISHLFSDMLTTGKVWLFGKKIGFVPKKIGKLKFTTGMDNVWEYTVYKFIYKFNWVLSLITLIYPLLIDERLTQTIMKMIRSA